MTKLCTAVSGQRKQHKINMQILFLLFVIQVGPHRLTALRNRQNFSARQRWRKLIKMQKSYSWYICITNPLFSLYSDDLIHNLNQDFTNRSIIASYIAHIGFSKNHKIDAGRLLFLNNYINRYLTVQAARIRLGKNWMN